VRDVADRDTVAGRGPSGGTRDDRDMVTGSYDPDRDAGYDPQAAGTAMGSATAGAGAGRASEPTDVRERDVEGGDLRDRGAPDRGTAAYDDRDYDPATDTAYVDEGRAETERGTGRRDADYDTGRVDAGRDRDARGAAGLGSAGAVAAGAALHDREGGREGFSRVDDTATVDPGTSGRATPDRSDDSRAAGRAAAVADDDADSGRRERLVPAERAHDYSSRWDALKGDFVDEPRRAVARADELVGELLDEIQRLFTDQRRELEQGFDHDRASTEDLRLALRRYRSFFDRLLSF
jgi:hypothetical protein